MSMLYANGTYSLTELSFDFELIATLTNLVPLEVQMCAEQKEKSLTFKSLVN